MYVNLDSIDVRTYESFHDTRMIVVKVNFKVCYESKWFTQEVVKSTLCLHSKNLQIMHGEYWDFLLDAVQN